MSECEWVTEAFTFAMLYLNYRVGPFRFRLKTLSHWMWERFICRGEQSWRKAKMRTKHLYRIHVCAFEWVAWFQLPGPNCIYKLVVNFNGYVVLYLDWKLIKCIVELLYIKYWACYIYFKPTCNRLCNMHTIYIHQTKLNAWFALYLY